MTTTVANARDLEDGWHLDPRFAYVGRSRGDMPELDGRLGNPFTLRREEHRGVVIQRHRNYFERKIERSPEFRARVEACRDKTLVCYCSPKPCHADVIAAWLNQGDAP